jgi:hypothetical protein
MPGKTPTCPRCGNPAVKDGILNSGIQRYACTKGCHWRGTAIGNRAAAESKGIDKKETVARKAAIVADAKVTEVQRYVITAAQNATPVNKPFFGALKTYAKKNDARLIIIPYRYKNPTAFWTQQARTDDWWATDVVPYLVDQRIDLNPNLALLADIKTQPTAERPLLGYETMTGGKSGIIGHPKLELETVPTPQQRMPKILTTTGACTVKNYIEAKAGKKGAFHHTFGACAVEVRGKTFHMRQINAISNGSFIDLDTYYDEYGFEKAPPAEALIMGDTHQEFVDPNVVEATFMEGGIVETLRPKRLVWHDIHDFYSRNHHHKDETFINYVKHHAKKDNVRQALIETFAFIDEMTPDDTTNVFVASNHPDALARWVKEANPKTDPENAIFWAETFVAMCRGAEWKNSGAHTIDPFAYWGAKMLTRKGINVFLRRGESCTISGIECGYHGDKGPNGTLGSIGGFGKIGVKTVTGHTHSPGIRGGAYRVGTNSLIPMAYSVGGPSSWLHTDCVIYANGKRSLINIIGSEWHA